MNNPIRMVLFSCICFVFTQINAQNNPTSHNPTNQNIVRSSTGISGSSEKITIDNNVYTIQQSIGQSSVIGTFTNNNYVIRQGFIQPNVLAKIIDKEIPLNLGAVIYPNPFKEFITISFKEKISNEVSIDVYDMLGRLVYQKNFEENQDIKIQLQNLSQENYILKVKANNKQLIQKIIKFNE